MPRVSARYITKTPDKLHPRATLLCLWLIRSKQHHHYYQQQKQKHRVINDSPTELHPLKELKIFQVCAEYHSISLES